MDSPIYSGTLSTLSSSSVWLEANSDSVRFNRARSQRLAAKPYGIGGIWGWVEPDSGGSRDLVARPSGRAQIRSSLPSAWAWTIVTITPPSPFISTAGPSNHYFLLTIRSLAGFQFLTPATPGHYGGSLAAGISANVTGTAVH